MTTFKSWAFLKSPWNSQPFTWLEYFGIVSHKLAESGDSTLTLWSWFDKANWEIPGISEDIWNGRSLEPVDFDLKCFYIWMVDRRPYPEYYHTMSWSQLTFRLYNLPIFSEERKLFAFEEINLILRALLPFPIQVKDTWNFEPKSQKQKSSKSTKNNSLVLENSEDLPIVSK